MATARLLDIAPAYELYLKQLVHAPSGHGKTRYLGTAVSDPRLMPGLLVDFEGGWTTIRSRCISIPLRELRTFVPPADKLVRVRLTHWSEIDEIYDVLQQNNQPYRFVGLDSLSEIHYLSLDAVIEKAVKNKSSKDPDQADQQDYGHALAQMRKFVRYFRDLEDIHVVFTATTMDAEDARTRRGLARPNLFGKFSNEAPALVDYVSYLGLAEKGGGQFERVLLNAASDRYVAKSRNDEDNPDCALPEMIEAPTLTKVLDALLGPASSGASRP